MSTPDSKQDLPDAMRAFGPLNVLAVVLCIPLIPFILGTPAVYVRLISVAITAIAVFSAVMMFKTGHKRAGIIYILIAVLFNPFLIFQMMAGVWSVAVILAGLWCAFAAWRYKGPGLPADHDEIPDKFF